MSKINALFTAAKAAPVKTTAIVVGTVAVTAGAVYGVKKFKAYRAEKASEEVVEEQKEKADA